MKSYRERSLNRKCQIAKLGPDGRPLADGRGDPVLQFGGQWFYWISGNQHQDNKRLIPVDVHSLLRWRAKEVEDGLRSRGVSKSVTPEHVYREFEGRFTNPGRTYAPPGRPEEFSIVLPKQACVNWQHGSSGSNGGLDDLLGMEDLSVFAQMLVGEEQSDSDARPAPKASGRRRKGHEAAEDTLESLGLADLA